MTTAKIETALGAMESQFQSVSGGGYVHDLSGPDAVQWRDLDGEPSVLPCVALALADVRSTPRTGMGRFRRDVRVDVVGFADPVADDPKSRTLQAVRLLDDLTRAIESDRSLGGAALDVKVHGTTFEGSQESLGVPLAGVVLSVEFYFHTDLGV